MQLPLEKPVLMVIKLLIYTEVSELIINGTRDKIKYVEMMTINTFCLG